MNRSRKALFSLALALGATLVGCGAARMSMDVPLTLGERMDPETTLAPRDGVATLVLLYPAPTDGTSQAITFVSQTGAFLGQAEPRSYLVTTVPAGELGVYAGRPEMSYHEWCHGMRGSVEAGKMYVLVASSAFGISAVGAANPERLPGEQLSRELSGLTRVRVNQAKGDAATQAALEDYWRPCINRGGAAAEAAASTGFAKLASAKTSTRIHPEWGYAPLTISPAR